MNDDNCAVLPVINIKLTQEQADNLSELLWAYQDEGPIGEGWSSPELDALRAAVDEAIAARKGARLCGYK